MRKSRWLGVVATLSLIAAIGYLTTSGANEPTPAKPAAPAADSPAPAAKPCCGTKEEAVPKEAVSRTCPLYCFAEIQEGENTAHYYYAIEYSYDANANPTCAMQGMGMMILEEDPAAPWTTCDQCDGGVKDGRKVEYKKAKLKKKLDKTESLKAKKMGNEDLAEEIGRFFVRLPLPNLADAKVLVKLFLVNPTIHNPDSPHRTRVMALGVEARGQGIDISTLPVAETVRYDPVGQRAKFTVDGIEVEALLIPR